MTNFYRDNGVTVLGSRLRQISERLTQHNREIYESEGIGMEPRWYPILVTLEQIGALKAGDLAKQTRQSHAAISQVITQMKGAGVVTATSDPDDGRSAILTLSDAGEKLARDVNAMCVDVSLAAASLVADTGYDLMVALEALDQSLDEKNLMERMAAIRDGEPIIVEYGPIYKVAFRDLNYAWIKKYFEVEAIDIEQLENAEESILLPGGAILVALVAGRPVGTCALERLETGRYELSKMAVDPSAHGKGIGTLLGTAIIRRAKLLGAKTLELESNTMLTPAINLYRKLGFEEIPVGETPYSRCNIRMKMSIAP